MENFKEFQGKDLDECIEQACRYYDCAREKLEIEIIQDAKSGIFGIVGARKAKIRARRVRLEESMHNLLDTEKTDKVEDNKLNSVSDISSDKESVQKEKRKPAQEPMRPAANKRDDRPDSQRKDEKRKNKNAKNQAKSEPMPPKVEEKQALNDSHEDFSVDEPEAPEGFQFKPLEELDATKIEILAKDAVNHLLPPLAGKEVTFTVDLSHGYVRIKVDWEGDAGLIIGRDGQTLAALQYLASRIISRGMNAALRVQLDIGEYRKRREDKLCELAHALAHKARHTGRAFSTRPLSSYHRRIIHLCLQNEPDVMTRSSGDGPLKRVLIAPRREHS